MFLDDHKVMVWPFWEKAKMQIGGGGIMVWSFFFSWSWA